MSLLDKIKGLFSRASLPDETRLLLSGVEDVAQLRNGLDEIVTRNEVEARDIEREIDKLAKMEEAHKTRVAQGELNQREKMATLREIKRLRRRMTSLEKRHRIHQDNIDLHLGLFDRITEMEAMELKKVTQHQIEEIAVDYEERLDKHRDIMAAAKAATGMESVYEDTAEQAELAALEREILAEAGVDAAEEEVEEDLEAELEQLEAAKAAKAVEAAEAAKAVDTAAKQPEAPARPVRRSLEEQLADLEASEQEEPDESALELE